MRIRGSAVSVTVAATLGAALLTAPALAAAPKDSTVAASRVNVIPDKAVRMRIVTPKKDRYADREVLFKGRVKVRKSLRDQVSVFLQRRVGDGRWKTRTRVGLRPNGRFVASDAPGKRKSVYRAHVRLYRNSGKLWDTAAKTRNLTTVGRADSGKRFVIGMGDSYMSGEGATYAQYGPKETSGNSSVWWEVAFGSSLPDTYPQDYAYPIDMKPTGVRCHRSESASMMWSRDDYIGLNLACSGATYDSTSEKPGLDLQPNSQITMLEQAVSKIKAQGDEVSSIQISIGGNDVQFAGIIEECVTKYLTPFATRCSNDPDSIMRKQVAAGLEPAKRAVREGVKNVVATMDQAGYARDSYRITVQTPPIGVPPASDFQTKFGGNSGWGRQGIGGCGFTDGDLNYFNDTLGPKLTQVMQSGADEARNSLPGSQVTVLDAGKAFASHQLCSKDVALNLGKGINDSYNTMHPPWVGFGGGSQGQWMTPLVLVCLMDSGVVNKLCGSGDDVWVQYPAVFRASGPNGWTDGCNPSSFWTARPLLSTSKQPPQCVETGENIYQLAMHPNYWGQRALAACHDQVATDEKTVNRTVKCASAGTTQDSQGRPAMKVTW